MTASWTATVTVPTAHVAAFELAFEETGFAISTEEVKGGRNWRVAALSFAAPDADDLRRRVAEAAAAVGIAAPVLDIVFVPARDWVSHTNKLLAPFEAGRFQLFGRHDRHRAKAGAWTLEIEAGLAFGTGRAPSTFGCLLAIDAQAKRRRARGGLGRVLDLGCGSGVLALAAARAGARAVTASDIDPVASRTARDNARVNGLANRVAIATAIGTRHALIQAGAPYDLICANILAEPLMRLAPAITGLLARSGRVVLSGLLAHEERAVAAVYRAQGLTLRGRIPRDGWHTLILGRHS